MAATYNFRSSFNGFNREDVVHYIEYTNSKHIILVNQLKADLAAALKENEELRAVPVGDPEAETTIAELQANITELEAKVQELETRCADLEQNQVHLQSQLAAVTAQRDAALSAQPVVVAPAPQQNTVDELEAYRRAERMERQAKERTDAMYRKANGVLADATVKVDEAVDHISGIADQVTAQLAILQEAVGGSKQALSEAAATLYAIRPELED